MLPPTSPGSPRPEPVRALDGDGRPRPALRLRDATPDDAPGVARVHVDSWRRAYHGLLDPDYLASLSVEGLSPHWEGIITGRADDRLVVVESDGLVQGFAHVGPSHDEDAVPGTTELYKLYVHPDRWGRGLGRAVHDAALEGLAGTGSRLVTLWVLGTNGPARRFYQRLGWSQVGGARVQYFGTTVCHDDRYARALPVG